MLQNGADCGGGRRMRTARLSRETCVVWPVAGCTRSAHAFVPRRVRIFRNGFHVFVLLTLSKRWGRIYFGDNGSTWVVCSPVVASHSEAFAEVGHTAIWSNEGVSVCDHQTQVISVKCQLSGE